MTVPTGPGPKPDVRDRLGRVIREEDVIAYAVGDGYLEIGVVAEIIQKVTPKRYYRANPGDLEWTARVKVKKNKTGTYGGSNMFSSLTKINNIVVLDGPEADKTRKEIHQSWVDEDE